MIIAEKTWLLLGLGFVVVAGGIWPLLCWLRRTALVDVPNERSSHQTPTPTGAGIVVIGALLPIWFLVAERPVLHVLIAAGMLALLSLRDDFKNLSTLVRLAGHGAAVAVVLTLEPGLAATAGAFLPEPAALIVTALAWIWFVNLFNFMDGIDGITGVETVSIGLGVAAVVTIGALPGDFAGLGLTAAAVGCGFLMWNWHPAKIFLGDVGSVPLGFMLGWLLLSLAASGAWAAAVILPAYYVFDATVTLFWRISRGQPFWRAHREHFYQQGLIAGLKHSDVSGFLLAANVVLIGIAVGSFVGSEIHGLVSALAVCLGLVAVYRRGDPGQRS